MHLPVRIVLPVTFLVCPVTAKMSGLAAQAVAQCAPLATLVQTVRDRATGVPLAGATVSATWNAGRNETVQVPTDAAGTAVICAPAGRTISLRVSYYHVRAGPLTTMLTDGQSNRHTFAIDAPTIFLRGTVLDNTTNGPIPNVAVTISNTTLSSISGPDGSFRFDQIPLGDHELSAAHLSYATVAAPLAVRESDLDITIRLAPSAIPLEPIVATAFSRRLDRVGFYERQRRGVGNFIDRKQIEAMNVQASADLLRNVPSMRLIPYWPRRTTARTEVEGRGRCRPTFIVDGARTLPDFDIDFVAPYAIEGIEVYRGAGELPALFRSHVVRDALSANCAVIAIWTRNSH